MKSAPFEFIIPVLLAFGLSKTGLLPRFQTHEKPAKEVVVDQEPEDEGGGGPGIAATAVIGLASSINAMTPESTLTLAKAGLGGPQAPADGGGGGKSEGGANGAMTAAIESGMKSVEGTDIEDALGFRADAAAGSGGQSSSTASPDGAQAPGAEGEGAGETLSASSGPAALAPQGGDDGQGAHSAQSPGGQRGGGGDEPPASAGLASAPGDLPPGSEPKADPEKLDFLQRSNLVLGKLLENKRSVDPFGMVMDPGSATEAPDLADQYEEVAEPTTVSNSALKNALMSLPITGVYPGKGLLVIGARSFPVGGQFGMKLQELTIRLRFEGIREGHIYFKDLETREVTSIPYDVRPAEFEPLRKGQSVATGGGIIPMTDLYIAN
jgi:hypothetical protein